MEVGKNGCDDVVNGLLDITAATSVFEEVNAAEAAKVPALGMDVDIVDPVAGKAGEW